MKNKKLGVDIKCFLIIIFMLANYLAMIPSSISVSASNQIIKVGCFPLNGFYDIASDDTVTGYGAEYDKIIFEHAGWDYEYVFYSSWVEALDSFSKNEIDILSPAQHTEERDKIYTFDSFPIGTEYGSLLTLDTSDTLIYEDYENFNHLNVGAVSSVVFLDDFEKYEKRNNFSVKMSYYKDTPSLIAALNAGEVDAVVVNMMVKTEHMKLLARFGAAPIYYMINPKKAYLQDELNQAIDKVTSNHPQLQIQLSDKYFPDFVHIPFSKEELDYIKQSGTLSVACGGEYPPFSYVDEKTGELTGVDRSILNKISEISGLSFTFEAIPFAGDVQAFMKQKNIVLIAGIENDEGTQLHSNNFSDFYLTVSKYFIGKSEKKLDTNANLKIAVMSSSESEITSWRERYPNFEFIHYASINDCVKAIHADQIDFMLEDRYSMENVLASPINQDLTILPTEVIESNICFRILLSDKKAEMLTSILNKAIHEIPESDKERFISDFTQINHYQYTAIDFLYQYRFQLIFALTLLVIFIIGLSFVFRVRRKARLAIKENEMKLRHITNNIKGGVVVLQANEGLTIIYANDGFLDMIGCTREQIKEDGKGSYLAYVHKDDLYKVQTAIDTEQKEMSLELRILKADGSYVSALFNCTAGEKNNGHKELYCVILDLTEQNKLLDQLRIEKHRMNLILDRVEEIFYEINMQNFTATTSNSFLEKMGWTLPKYIPKAKDGYKEIWHTDEENLEKLRISTEEMQEKKQPVSVIVRIESKIENRFVWYEVFQHPILNKDGMIVTVIGLIRDVDKQVAEREKLIEQAQRDPLTGLYNKETFENIVTDTLLKMPKQNHALIFIDLDHFKILNDTLGHMMGDRAICEAADKLRVVFSNYDILSRFGGDEFCVFVKNIPFKTLKDKMDWLVNKLHADYQGKKGSVRVTCSCGIVCTECVKVDYQVLMKNADEALYHSKENGRDCYTFYQDLLTSNSN